MTRVHDFTKSEMHLMLQDICLISILSSSLVFLLLLQQSISLRNSEKHACNRCKAAQCLPIQVGFPQKSEA